MSLVSADWTASNINDVRRQGSNVDLKKILRVEFTLKDKEGPARYSAINVVLWKTFRNCSKAFSRARCKDYNIFRIFEPNEKVGDPWKMDAIWIEWKREKLWMCSKTDPFLDHIMTSDENWMLYNNRRFFRTMAEPR